MLIMRRTLFFVIFNLWVVYTIDAQVQSDFTADQTQGCGALQVKFRNQSSGQIKSYLWDFGNGTSSTSPDPIKIFITAGQYKVCLTVTDSAGNKDTKCKLNFITIHANYFANFKAVESVICAGAQGQFEDVSQSPNGKIVSWIWDLNGSAGVVQQSERGIASSVYDNPGKYNITLNVTDEAGCNATVSKAEIQVIPKPVVNISIPYNTICDTIGQIVFKNTSPNSMDFTYEWEFGNGQKYSGFEPPPVTYQGKGTYDVHVTAIHASTGCKATQAYPGAVVIADLAPFTLSKTKICENETVVFNPLTLSNIDNHFWDFGDGSSSNDANPRHAYSKSGSYVVKHRIVSKGCISERISPDSLKVNGKPTVGYKLNDTVGCMLPLKIVTSNQSEGAVSFSWTANGQQISTEQQPLLEFPVAGDYKIGLLTTNEYGCTAFIEHKTVHAYKITPDLITPAFRSCAPLLSYPLEYKSLSLDPITKVTWTVNTPTIKVFNTATAALAITDTGSFNIKLVVQNSLGCTDSAKYNSWIQLGSKPVTGMVLPVTICYGQRYLASDSSSSFANEFLWSSGNNILSQGTKQFQFIYDKLGPLTITHASSQYGCLGNLITDSVEVIGAKADFQFQVEDCNNPLTRIFINQSTASDSVHWDFGVIDSISDQSIENNPKFSYPKKGNFKVTLQAINKGSGCPSDSISRMVELKELKADFKLDHRSGCAPQDLAVINLSEDASSYSFIFPFSDQNSSTEFNPVFRFSKGVNTKGTLIATDISGCKDTVSVDSISIYQPIAELNPSSSLLCQDSILTLINSSRAVNDSIIKIVWSYPVRTILNQDTINIRLDTITTPRVLLKVETVKGCVAEASLDLSVNKIRATLQTDTLVCIKDSVFIKPLISGRWNHVKWDFGDEGTSMDLIGSHQYKSNGFYHVKATIWDDASGCRDTFSFPQKINVGDPQALLDFTTGSTNCRPLIAKFQNKSKLVDKFEWDFGDGSGISNERNPSHLYIDKGYFDVRLIAKSSERCRDTLIIDSAIFVDGPSILVSTDSVRTQCLPVDVRFNTTFINTKSALMEWGDGGQDTLSDQSGKQSFRHTYNTSGIYYPVLLAIDKNACTEFAILDTIVVHQTIAHLLPGDSLICALEGDFAFVDSSVSSSLIQKIRVNIKSDGLDTTFDHIPMPFHTSQAGKYSVNFYLANEFCADSAEYNDLFQLSYRPNALYSVNQVDFCAGDTIRLVNQSVSLQLPISAYYWKDDEMIRHGDSINTVLEQGLKTFTLIAQTQVGCSDTARLDLDVKPSIFSSLTHDTLVCAGSLISLRSSILNPLEGMSYKWFKQDSTLCNQCADYTFRPESSSDYHFVTVHPNGCTRSYQQIVQTRPNPIKNIQMTHDTVVCMGEPFPILVSSLNDVFAYSWDSTRAGLSCYQFCRNPIALPASQTTYVVRISDGTGCERFDSIKIDVKVVPPIELGPDRTICKNDSLALKITNLTQPRWTGSPGISCSNCDSPVLRPLGFSRYILSALSQGCPVKDSIHVSILTNDLIEGSGDTTICVGSGLRLKGLSDKIKSWSPVLFLDNPSSVSPNSIPTRSITYHALATEDLCTTTDSIKINVLTKTVIKGFDRTVCPMDIVTLSVTGEADQFQWIGPNIISGQNSNSIQIKANNSAVYKVMAKNKTCEPDSKELKVEVVDFIRLKDSIEYHAASGQPFKLNKSLNANKKFVFTWTPSSGLSCSNCQDPVFTGTEPRVYTFSIMDPATSCALDQRVKVNITESCNAADLFSVPNIFTPNTDGKNDILFPVSKSTDQIKSFRIFDRSGDEVFQSFDIGFGWDGRLKGREAAIGVYVYVLEAICPQTGQSVFLAGDVTLIR
jgi:gliding motility-associated-like protein